MSSFLNPSTTGASAALAQSREHDNTLEKFLQLLPIGQHKSYEGEGDVYDLDSKIHSTPQAYPYEHKTGEPLYRPLRIYTLDPSASNLDGAVALVNVPYEPLNQLNGEDEDAPKRGPTGVLFEIDPLDGGQQVRWNTADLDAPRVLIQNGYQPSPSSPEFHQQMVYAVCSLTYASFQRALGRHISWGFTGKGGKPPKLRICPHAADRRNAYYDPKQGTLSFGYYQTKPEEVSGHNLPGGYVFTCLSHDVIVHEMTHALLDGLRSSFTIASNPDVPAFHEALADLVAVFQHFSYREVVKAAMNRTRGRLEEANLLTNIAGQFGHTTGKGGPLRNAIDLSDPPKRYDEVEKEPHKLGSILVSAIFEAFLTIFRRKTARLIRLATGGSGILPEGALSPDLCDALADEACKLASQFLSICIRAIDYCPPVDLEFGEYLRAVITADYDLVPDDPWGYREAWINAFRRRGIYPRHVDNLSVDSLLWRPPNEDPLPWRARSEDLPLISFLNFANLRFNGSPVRAASREELRRQACALGWYLSQSPERLKAFGFVKHGEGKWGNDKVERPCVQSIRSSQRVGPDGQVIYDLIAEVTQQRVVRDENGRSFSFFGGSTVIIDPNGAIRYIIVKRIDSEARMARQRDFLHKSMAQPYWLDDEDGVLQPNPDFYLQLHHE